MVQTAVSQDPAVAVAGLIADCNPQDIISKILATTTVVAGALVKHVIGDEDDRCEPIATGTITARNDPDAFKTNIGSTGGIQTFTGADFEGVIGAGRFWPPLNAVLVLNSHADWDATTAVIVGLDEYGRYQTEDLTIPNNGNATVVGVKFWSKIDSLVIPAQSGTNGTATFGTGTRLGPLTARDILGVVPYQAAREPGAYAVGDDLPVLEKGRIWVNVEAAVSVGDPAYVRIVAGGGESVGAFGRIPDGTPVTNPDAALLLGARFVTSTTGAGLAELELDLAA